MSTFSSALTALAGPLAKRVLVSLGIGIVSYAALLATLHSALDHAKALFGAVPADLLQIIARFGFFDAMAIEAGALIASVTLIAGSRLARLT